MKIFDRFEAVRTDTERDGEVKEPYVRDAGVSS